MKKNPLYYIVIGTPAMPAGHKFFCYHLSEVEWLLSRLSPDDDVYLFKWDDNVNKYMEINCPIAIG